LTPEERLRRDEAETTVFRWNVGMKLLSAFILMHLRFYKRPAGRPWFYDLLLMYSGAYAFLLSNVVGVYKAWP
jgi:hypothetical protein